MRARAGAELSWLQLRLHRVVIAATGYAGSGPNLNIPVALGGIIAAGALYTVIGLIVQAVATPGSKS